jgi:hypothetical protein
MIGCSGAKILHSRALADENVARTTQCEEIAPSGGTWLTLNSLTRETLGKVFREQANR